jgi:hypothetical protein
MATTTITLFSAVPSTVVAIIIGTEARKMDKGQQARLGNLSPFISPIPDGGMVGIGGTF